MKVPTHADLIRQLLWMRALQDRHNQQIHPDWRGQEHDYYRAVWIECAELLEHYGWKWWKRQTADMEQVRIEVVDIWHFGLSEIIRSGLPTHMLARRIEAALALPPPPDVRVAVEALVVGTLRYRMFDLEAFCGVLLSLPLDFNELYETYVAKNVLNTFRQTHGYQEGVYRKIWAGREDNAHLADLLRDMDSASDDFPTALAAALEARYAATDQPSAPNTGECPECR